MKKQDGARGTRRFTRGVGEWLSYANVMSTIAVFGVLGGGGAYAASKIGPNDVKRGAVRSKHIKDGTIVSRDIKLRTRAALRGQQGPKGATGARGPAGPKGATGARGPAGPKGDATGFAANCNEGLAANDVMVRVGSVCIDRYEASIWTARTGGSQITGAIPCTPNGQDCTNIYARSVAGVAPRADITWFQAQQALANSGKRLPSNAEWQMAVAGTPDSTACNVSTGSVQNTGENARCISNHGTNDMVGNVWEWVADWDEQASGSACADWPEGFGSDVTCIGRGSGEPSTHSPGALLRGGNFLNGTLSGPFAIQAFIQPSSSNNYFGFRGAR